MTRRLPAFAFGFAVSVAARATLRRVSRPVPLTHASAMESNAAAIDRNAVRAAPNVNRERRGKRARVVNHVNHVKLASRANRAKDVNRERLVKAAKAAVRAGGRANNAEMAKLGPQKLGR